ncbi:hypothetical protein WA556_002138, partial [Blastocystis sp. ATCC 50177/Nand II]
MDDHVRRVSFSLLVSPLAEVKLTLVWTDPPASVFSSSVMVNDIDLEVALGDTLFFPNNLSEPDRTNNVEMIRLSPTVLQANGTEMANITVSIRAHRLETQSQTYSLVVTGVFDTENQPIVYRD